MSNKEQNPTVQPAPVSNGHPPPETESAAGEPRKKNRAKCMLYVLLFVIFQTGIILIFALVIMKVQTPKFRLRSATFQNSTATNGSITGTITAELSLRNANFGKYRYRNATVAFFHKGSEIGAGEVMGSSVNWRSTRKMEMAAELDLGRAKEVAGVVSVESRGRMEGTVAVVFVMKKKRSTAMDCRMEIVTASGEIQNVVCN